MIIGTQVTNPGELRTPLTLWAKALTTDAGGAQIAAAPVKLADVWAKWTDVHGNEVWAAQAVKAVEPATVRIRYRADVNSNTLVQKGEKYFEVIGAPDDIQQQHEYLELKVTRMAGAIGGTA
jgi:SPP1 family predicted phage head-tail adaptor